jgi:hypothetical protein
MLVNPLYWDRDITEKNLMGHKLIYLIHVKALVCPTMEIRCKRVHLICYRLLLTLEDIGSETD